MINKQIAHKKTYYSLENCRAALKRVYDYAIKYDYADYLDISEAPAGEKKEKHPFTDEQRQQLWDSHESYMEKLALVLMYTGLRRAEIANLKKDDIDIDQKLINIKASKTDAGVRVVPICDRIYPLFKEIYDGSSVYFIENRFGKKYTTRGIDKTFSEVMDKLGYNRDLHKCRHTLATMLDNKDAKPLIAKKIMGHKIADATSGVYTHKTLDQLRETMNLLD